MSGETVQKFAADFKKAPGIITLTPTHIAWVPNAQGAMDRQNQAMNRVVNMLASKAGSAKVSLKLLFKDDLPAGGLHFTFTNPDPTKREGDRKVIQDTLIPFVSANRAGPSVPTPAAGAMAEASSSAPGTPSAVVGAKRKIREEEGAAVSSPAPSNGSGAATVPAGRKSGLMELKLKVLRKNPNLRELFNALVAKKGSTEPDKITEAEFWQGREALLRAEEIAQAQKPGRQPRLIDDRFGMADAKRGQAGAGGTGVGIKTKADAGPTTFSLRREDIAQIFEEFPVVQDAYSRYVPGISEADFWLRYFQSQLWERQRASERRTVNDETTRRKDDIFDQYLEDPDWNVQPREKQPENIERFLDLSATEEDHGETTTQRDHTMQAGRERGALPLIRRFNANAARLSKTGRPESSTGGYLNTALPDDVNIYDEIDLEDLRGPAQEQTISLEVQEVDEAKDGEKSTRRGIVPDKSEEELLEMASHQAEIVTNYSPALGSVNLVPPEGGWEKNRQEATDPVAQAKAYERYQSQKLAGDAAAHVVKDMHVASNAENAISTPFPEAIFDQMRSCHNAATEFLRQYWSALLPLSAGSLGGSTPNTVPKGKEARDPVKAEKMANYLRSTERKIEAVVHTAQLSGVDPERVKAALAPTLGAVNVALSRESIRIGSTV